MARKDQTYAAKQDSLKRHLPERREKFRMEVYGYAEAYPQEMLDYFFLYWTEPNKSGSRMRFELERTWNTNLRLKFWARNDKQYGNNRKPFNKQQQLQEEADARRRDFIEAVHELNGGRPVAGLPDL